MGTFTLLFLEKICEAIYFAMFLLIGKNIKEKRLLFILVMIFEYILLKKFIHYNIWFQIIYTFMSFINLKIFYKDKAQITDIFLFMFASIILMLVSYICVVFQLIIYNENYIIQHIILLIINRILIFIVLYFMKDKLNIWYKKYYKLWNRNNKKTKIRSLTLRNISIIIFNFMFYIINIGLLYIIYTNK